MVLTLLQQSPFRHPKRLPTSPPAHLNPLDLIPPPSLPFPFTLPPAPFSFPLPLPLPLLQTRLLLPTHKKGNSDRLRVRLLPKTQSAFALPTPTEQQTPATLRQSLAALKRRVLRERFRSR